jgi:hypothetical protein
VCSLDPRLSHLIPAQIIDLSLDSARSFEIGIVERNQYAVAGEVNVGLKEGVSEINRMLKCSERIFRRIAHSAPMGERKDAIPLKKRVRSPRATCCH